MNTTNSPLDVFPCETNPLVARLREDVAAFDAGVGELDRQIHELQEERKRVLIQRDYASQLLSSLQTPPAGRASEGSEDPPELSGRAKSLAALERINRERRAAKENARPNPGAPR